MVALGYLVFYTLYIKYFALDLSSRVHIHQNLRQSALSVFQLLLGSRFSFFYMLNEPPLSDKITAVAIAGNSDLFFILMSCIMYFLGD